MAASGRATRRSLSSSRIRVCALGVVRDGDRILVFRGFDPVKREAFYRPLGGGVEFGERAADAVRRELHEEIGATVTSARLLGTVENIFCYTGEPGHEIVFLYEVELAGRELYDCERIEHAQDNDEPLDCRWMPLSAFADGGPPLYPDGLLELLESRRS